MKNSVLIDYSKLPDEELDNFSDVVYKALNPNANFTWAANVMTTFQTNITTYRAKLHAAMNGSSTDVAAKNAGRKILITSLRDIAMEVNRQSAGDLVKLRSSGLTLAKERGKVGVLPKPESFKVSTGINSGELLFKVNANESAIMYNFYAAPVPAPDDINKWRLIPSTTHKKNVAGFTPGVQYAVKCAYQGTDPHLNFSETFLIYAQ